MYDVKVHSPNSLEEALYLKNEYKESLTVLAGGTDLLINLQEQEEYEGSKPDLLNISRIKELNFVKENRENIEVGSLVTHDEIVHNRVIQEYIPSLSKAASIIGSPQIRNQGTIGGNIVNASPAADLLPILYARDAEIEIITKEERNQVPIGEFIKGPGSVNLNPTGIVTKIVVPKLSGYRGDYLSLRQRKAVSISKVSLGVEMLVSTDKVIRDIRIALGAVSPTIVRGIRTEKLLRRRKLDPDLIKEACNLIKTECVPIDDIRSNSNYRSEMIAVLFEKVLENK
jgi:CO/xanthine dehydrogenase FAD-binding subunit